MPYPLSLPLDANSKPAPFYSSANITTTATTLVKSGAGFLNAITLSKPVATGTIAIYDGLTAAGTLLGTFTIPASPQPSTIPLNIYFGTGLCIVTGTAAQDIIVTYA